MFGRTSVYILTFAFLLSQATFAGEMQEYEDFGKPFAAQDHAGFQNPDGSDPGTLSEIEPAAGDEPESGEPQTEDAKARNKNAQENAKQE